MKACGVVAISAVVLIILGISLYFGLRKVGKVNVTYVPFSSKFSKFDIPISKDRSVLVIDLDNGSFLDNDKLSSTSSDVPGLDGYKKILFSSPQRKHIDEAMVRYDKLEIVPGIFSRATIYTWFGDPMLLIINTIQVVDDKEVNRFHYFTHSDGSFGSYSAYQIDTDIQDNLVEIQKLLKKINKDRKHLFTLDLDNDLGDPTIEYPSLEPDGFNVTKYLDRYKPFIDVKLKSPLRINGSKFQIDKLIHNGKDIKINLPNYQFYFIFIYYWNMNPVLIDFESKTKHNYFVSRSADEWIPLTNCSGHIINGQLSDQELRKRLKYIIMKTFNAYFLDIDNTDSYDFSGEEVSVITERPTSDDVGTSIKYKHFLPKGVFKLGACSQNGVLIDVVPIGLDLEYMTVHYSNSISIMIRLAVVENGKKRDIYVNRDAILRWRIGKKPVKTREYNKPQDNKPQDNKPQDNKPRDNKPRDNKPQDNKPRDNKPQDNKPQDNKPQDNKPQDNKPQDNKPRDNKPQDNKPQDNKPRDNKPQDNKPQDNKPRDNKPRDNKPQDNKPQDNKPQDNKPRDNKPQDNKPQDNKPQDNKPQDNKPQDNKPQDNKPQDNKPQDNKPQDNKPQDNTSKNTEDSTPLFDESKNDIIKLDVGKKRDYKCITNSASSKCSKISVKYNDKFSLCTIYTQEPVHSNPSEKSKNSFMYSGMTFNGNKISGIVPGKISKMNVYFLDDIVPVGIQMVSNETIYFINEGKNHWKVYNEPFSIFLFELRTFSLFSRANNFVVAFDAGKKVIHVDRGEPPSLNSTDYGVYKEYAIQLPEMNEFIFHGLTFKGLWYKFDAGSLFNHKFVQMKVYYDPNDKIPLMFELSGEKSFRFYNQFDGTWKKQFFIFDDCNHLLDLTYAKIAGAISIDNYRDYNNGSTDITVAATKFTDKYVKLVHTPTHNVKFSLVLYRAYFIKPTFKIPEFNSLTVYFKAGTHLALMIQFHVNSDIYTSGYDMSDSWGFLEPSSDILKTLDDIHSKFYPAGS